MNSPRILQFEKSRRNEKPNKIEEKKLRRKDWTKKLEIMPNQINFNNLQIIIHAQPKLVIPNPKSMKPIQISWCEEDDYAGLARRGEMEEQQREEAMTGFHNTKVFGVVL